MNNIMINATALKSAGGRSVGLNFLKGLLKSYSDCDNIHFYYYVPKGCGYEHEVNSKNNINVFFVDSKLLKWYDRNRLESFLKEEISKKNINTIFSMGNIALNVEIEKQVLLIHWPYLVYPKSEVWNRMLFFDKLKRLARRKLTEKRLKYAHTIMFQTETMRKRFENIYGAGNFKTTIVPNAVSSPSKINDKDIAFEQKLKNLIGNKKSFLCLTRYYEHKNIEILLEVAKSIKEQNDNYCIVLTIDKNQGKKAEKLLNNIKERKLQDYLINIGEVKWHNIPKLYELSDAILLPTLLESYSGVYVESMYYNKPILTSKLDFAQEVCEDAALYFNPFDANDIYFSLKKIRELDRIDLEEKYKELLSKNISWNNITDLMVKEIL